MAIYTERMKLNNKATAPANRTQWNDLAKLSRPDQSQQSDEMINSDTAHNISSWILIYHDDRRSYIKMDDMTAPQKWSQSCSTGPKPHLLDQTKKDLTTEAPIRKMAAFVYDVVSIFSKTDKGRLELTTTINHTVFTIHLSGPS